jgi:hypothetical protein
MKKPERFRKNVLEHSQAKTLGVLQSEYIVDKEEFLLNEENCACGQHLKVGWKAYYVYNVKTKETLIIGSCCFKKFNPRKWSTKKAYLYNAYDLARYDKEKEFVESLINKLTKYGSGLIVSKKQALWLESITKKKWEWKIWKSKVTRLAWANNR